MQKIIMPTEETKNFLEVFEMFVISQSAKGVADVTIRNYRYHMKNIGNYMNLDRPFDDVTKRDIENMVAAMRQTQMAHNSIATYTDTKLISDLSFDCGGAQNFRLRQTTFSPLTFY